MKWLYLLRHAKSSWDHPELKDIDRPLNRRGIEASRLMGGWMNDHVSAPDLILCSPARRTQQTLEILLPESGFQTEISTCSSLYHGGADAYIHKIRDTKKSVGTLMIVGHNPTIHWLTQTIVEDGASEALGLLHAKYPTGALAVVEFKAEDWSEIERGVLTHFMWPRHITKM